MTMTVFFLFQSCFFVAGSRRGPREREAGVARLSAAETGKKPGLSKVKGRIDRDSDDTVGRSSWPAGLAGWQAGKLARASTLLPSLSRFFRQHITAKTPSFPSCPS